MAIKADITIYQGDDFSAIVVVSSANLSPDQVLNGYTAQAQIRSGPADSNPTIIASMVTSISSPNIYLSIPNSVTKTMPGANFVWDLQISSPDVPPRITTLLAGNVQVTLEVTRP